jgi:hypothetical protein
MLLPVVPRGATTPPPPLPPSQAAAMAARSLWFTLTLPSSQLPRSRFLLLHKNSRLLLISMFQRLSKQVSSLILVFFCGKRCVFSPVKLLHKQLAKPNQCVGRRKEKKNLLENPNKFKA